MAKNDRPKRDRVPKANPAAQVAPAVKWHPAVASVGNRSSSWRDDWAIAKKAYSEEFLSNFGREFKFDATQPNVIEELSDIAARYMLAGRLIEPWEEARKDERAQYLDFQESIRRFRSDLISWGDYDIAGDMTMAARVAGEPRPTTYFPQLTEHQKHRGDAYYQELLRLINLLEASVAKNIDKLAPPRGRKRNDDLEIFVLKLSDFWVDVLGRPFTVDYHLGTGVTEAFKFVKMLIGPIDNIPDKRIVTAMRTIIKKWHPKSPKRPANSRRNLGRKKFLPSE